MTLKTWITACALIFSGSMLAGCSTNMSELDRNGGPVTAVTGATVVDAKQQIRNATVLIQGNTIVAVGPSSKVKAPAGARSIEGRGKFLIPGLWDAHVHLSYYPDLGIEASYPLFIVNGVTSVRDTGGLVDIVLPMRDTAQAPGAIAPRVYVSGPLVDGTQRVYAGLSGRPNISVGVSTPEDARAQINELHAAGVDFIKLYEMNAPETFKAAAQRANALGLPITSHVPLSMDAVDAAQAGVDGMEHLRNLELSCAVNFQALLAERQKTLAASQDMDGGELRSTLHRMQRSAAIEAQDSDRCNDVIATLRREQVFQTPTLTVNTVATKRLFIDPEWQKTFVYLPPNVQAQWAAGAERFDQSMRSSAEAEAFTQWSYAMVKKLQDGGVKVMAGTDNPIGFLTPGFSLHKELAFLVESGLTPMEALAAATLHPAQFMRLDDKLGTVEVGKLADLVLVDADPRKDIGNAHKINTVIKDGRVFDQDDIHQLFADLRTAYATNAQDGGVLVFGGTGRLGSEIVKDLAAAGEKVTVVTRPTSDRARLDGLDVNFIVGDMLVDEDMERIFKSAKFRVVVDGSGQVMGGADSFYYESQKLITKWAKATGVQQIILHGATGAGDSARMFNFENVSDFQRTAIEAKSIAEDILVNSGVPYTIMRHLTLLQSTYSESGAARLSEDRTTVGPVTRDGLARLTLECLDAPRCMNKIFHAVDDEVDLGDRREGMRRMYRAVLKPEFLKLP